MVILFILLLLLAIWAAFKFGGVRKVEGAPTEDESRWHGGKRKGDNRPEAVSEKSREDDRAFRGKGGRFGGGGASGSWGDDDGDSPNRR